MKRYFTADSMTISSQMIYYRPLNLASDQQQALNMHALLKFTEFQKKMFQ